MNVDFIPGFIQEWNFDPSLLYMIPNRHFIPERGTVEKKKGKMEWKWIELGVLSFI